MARLVDLSDVPIVDNHAHALAQRQPSTPEDLRSHFTEAHSPQLARDSVGSAANYRWAQRQIAELLGVDPNDAAILQARAESDFPSYVRRLVGAANLSHLLLDEGFPPAGEGYSSAEMADLSGIGIGRILRIETLVESLIGGAANFDDLLVRFDASVTEAIEGGFVALKSIAAYRTGLAIRPKSEADAASTFDVLRPGAGPGFRLESKTLIDFFVRRALAHAAQAGIPMQFHTGYGDPDLDLRLASPLHLRPLFEDDGFVGAPIVLLHESYPFTAEAAFLAAVYPNAYLDLAFSLPPVGRFELRRCVAIALATAPTDKLLVSSDGTRIPEHYYLGAVRARSIVEDVLGEMLSHGEIAPADATEFGRAILNGNAARIYRLTA